MLSVWHLRHAPLARAAVICGLVALPIAGCAATAATLPRSNAAATQAGPNPPGTAPATIDRLTAVARQRYATEVRGGQAQATLHRVARDAGLRRPLASGDPTKVRAYVRSEFNRV